MNNQDPRTPAAESDLKIEKLVYGGDGLARQEGRVVLTPRVLPGETVRVRVTERKKDLLRATPVTVIEPSPDRVSPRCPYFGPCGGCQYQHAAYPYQLDQKRSILREVMARVGKLEIPIDIGVIAGEPYGYRNRSQFHVKDRQLGYLAAGSHRLVAIKECPISSPKLNAVITALRSMLGDRRWPSFLRELEAFTDETSVQLNVIETDRPLARGFFDWCADRVSGFVPGALEYPAAGLRFRVSGQSFFQVNRFLVDQLVAEAIGGIASGTALDLYAGVGLFSLPLAQRGVQVTAVETGLSAVKDLEANAARASVDVEVRRQAVEEFLAQHTSQPDAVIADPPRAGLGRRVVEELLRLRPARLTIVACDPATLARDLSVLLAGGFRLERMTLVDLFPQTAHLETVVHLAC